jgi:retron-type reverse transcriptase
MAGPRRIIMTSPSLSFPNNFGGEIEKPWKGHPLFSLERLFAAYRLCRRRKRGTLNALDFEFQQEKHLMDLQYELESGLYRPRPYVAFLVEKPKKREIFAADFRDRVVHHVIAQELTPFWERRMIYDSFACRVGKGTLSGVHRLHQFFQKVTANQTRNAYYLQLDIKGFFIQIDKNILYRQLKNTIHDDALNWLIRTVLFFDPTRDCRLRKAKISDFLRLPDHKTLFKAKHECGLPIGNLTSQLFANIYLDPLDQFVKHELKIRYYLRYCDDLVMLHEQRDLLEHAESQIKLFLSKHLALSLNQRRTLRSVNEGVDFLGYISRPSYRLIRQRVVMGFIEKLTYFESKLFQYGLKSRLDNRRIEPFPEILLERLRQSVVSYLAHFSHGNSFNLKRQILKRFPWLTWVLRRKNGKVVVWQSRFYFPVQ